MFIDNSQGTGVPTDPPASGALPEYQYEDVRLMLLGSLTSVQNTIALLFNPFSALKLAHLTINDEANGSQLLKRQEFSIKKSY